MKQRHGITLGIVLLGIGIAPFWLGKGVPMAAKVSIPAERETAAAAVATVASDDYVPPLLGISDEDLVTSPTINALVSLTETGPDEEEPGRLAFAGLYLPRLPVAPSLLLVGADAPRLTPLPVTNPPTVVPNLFGGPVLDLTIPPAGDTGRTVPAQAATPSINYPRPLPAAGVAAPASGAVLAPAPAPETPCGTPAAAAVPARTLVLWQGGVAYAVQATPVQQGCDAAYGPGFAGYYAGPGCGGYGAPFGAGPGFAGAYCGAQSGCGSYGCICGRNCGGGCCCASSCCMPNCCQQSCCMPSCCPQSCCMPSCCPQTCCTPCCSTPCCMPVCCDTGCCGPKKCGFFCRLKDWFCCRKSNYCCYDPCCSPCCEQPRCGLFSKWKCKQSCCSTPVYSCGDCCYPSCCSPCSYDCGFGGSNCGCGF